MIIFFLKLLLLWEFTVSKGAKGFIFRLWLLFWHCPIMITRNLCVTGDVERRVQGVSGIAPAHPPQVSSKSLSRHFHFPCTVQAYAKGWETTSCFFYNWAQRYKNLILSPFMLPIKLQMLLLNGVPLMHIIEWVISQPPALWFYWAKCCPFPLLKHFLLSFQLLLCMNFPEQA